VAPEEAEREQEPWSGRSVIVSRRGDRLVLVRQVDHQTQCGLLAEAWGNADFARPEPYEPLVTAAAWHDEGWRRFDDAPEVDAEGSPIDFPDLDRSRHVALYAEGIRAAVRRDPRAGLIVSLHGQGLHEARLGLDGPPRPRERQEPAVRAFLEEQELLQERLRRQIGAGPALNDWAWAGFRLLQAWDLLSLYLLWFGLPRGRSGSMPQVPRRTGDPGLDVTIAPAGESACIVRPWPFAEDEVRAPVAARSIPARRYESDEDLRSELGAAPWEMLDVRLRRG
jgi:hypothetical protein